MLKLNRQGKLWLNVASSKGVLEDFVNLDNSIWLAAPRFLAPLLKATYRKEIKDFREARGRATVVRRDCRKPLPVLNGEADHILCSHFLEHVYPREMEMILRDFHRALKPGGTLHVIVPDLKWEIDQYLKVYGNGDHYAADAFLDTTLLSRKDRGSLKYRFLEFSGGLGLRHRWMYDRFSISARIREAGFNLLDTNDTPSKHFREQDEYSVHVVGQKAV
jgi:SAM-dependent methyltransferase